MPLNKVALIANITTDMPDNSSYEITAADVRDNILDMVDTTFDIPGDSTRSYSLTVNQGLSTTAAVSVTGTLMISAGTATQAPVRLASGTNLTTPVAGAIEFDGTNLYYTKSSGPTRTTLASTTLYDVYVNWTGRCLTNSSGNCVLNWESQELRRMDGDVVVDWQDQLLYHQDGSTSIDWENCITYDINTNTSINWTDRLMSDASGVDSINWEDRTATDTGNTLSLDWNSRLANDSDAVTSLDWQTRYLADTAGFESIDWEERKAIDANGDTSIDWDNRILWDTYNAHAITYNTGLVGIGSGTSSKKLHVFATADSDGIMVENSYAGQLGPTVTLFHKSASPTGSDTVGRMIFNGRDSALNTHTYAEVHVDAIDTQNLNEQGMVTFKVSNSGNLVDALIIHEDGNVGIGDIHPGKKLNVYSAMAGDGICIENVNSGNSGATLDIYHNSANPTGSDTTGSITFSGENSSGAKKTYAQMRNVITSAVSGTERGELILSSMVAGTARDKISVSSGVLLDNSGGTSANWESRLLSDSSSVSSVNYSSRTLHDSAGNAGVNWEDHVLYDYAGGYSVDWENHWLVDANAVTMLNWSDGKVAIGPGTPISRAHIFATGATDGLTVENSNTGNSGALLDIYHNSTSPAASDEIALINLNAKDSGGNKTTYGQVKSIISSTTNNSEAGQMLFSSIKSGALTESFRINETATLALAAGDTTRAPIKFTSGTNLTTPVAGSMEFDGTNLYITQTSGPTRQTISLGASGSYVPTSRIINTTAPMTGTGSLSADLTLGMPAAATAASGYLTSTDWNTFNNKAPTASPTFTGTITLPGSSQIGSTGTIGIGTAALSYAGLVVGGQDIWCIGSNVRFLFGQDTSTYSTFQWDTSASKLHILGNGNLANSTAAITIPFVAGQASLVGINQNTPTATLDVTCNRSNTTQVTKVQTTQASGDPVVENTIQQKIATTNNTQQFATITSTTSNYTYLIKSTVVARRTSGASGAAGDSASYELSAQFNNTSGTLTKASPTLKTEIWENQTGWDADLDASGTSIRLAVSGATSNDITWHSTTRIYPLGS